MGASAQFRPSPRCCDRIPFFVNRVDGESDLAEDYYIVLFHAAICEVKAFARIGCDARHPPPMAASSRHQKSSCLDASPTKMLWQEPFYPAPKTDLFVRGFQANPPSVPRVSEVMH